MKMDRKTLWFMVVLSMWVGFPAISLLAEEEASESSTAAFTTHREIMSDKEAIRTEKEQMKSNALASKREEKALQEQIKQAIRSGDKQTAESLKAQLKAMHQENVQLKQQDKQDLKEARQELRSDKKEARIDRMDKNNDGTVDQTERVKYEQLRGKRDKDNNPPGAAGGPGTNWENPPGAKGGPGASPNRGGHRR